MSLFCWLVNAQIFHRSGLAVTTMTSFEDNWAQVVFDQAKDRILGTAGTQVSFSFFS